MDDQEKQKQNDKKLDEYLVKFIRLNASNEDILEAAQ